MINKNNQNVNFVLLENTTPKQSQLQSQIVFSVHQVSSMINKDKNIVENVPLEDIRQMKDKLLVIFAILEHIPLKVHQHVHSVQLEHIMTKQNNLFVQFVQI